MYQSESHLQNITRFLTRLRVEVALRNSINLYDINIHAEYFYKDLLNLVYDWGLENLNVQTKNAAYIDLVDTKNKKAIQVTSQNDRGKIERAIKGFFSNDENKGFELKILLIAKSAKNYKADFTDQGKYKFDHKKDIIDLERLLTEIRNKGVDELAKLAEFLSKEEIKFPSISQASQSVPKFLPGNFPKQEIYFTGRSQVLENIARALETHGTAAFADTHGVGKSSVAIEFAYRNQEKYKNIFFIRATDNEFNVYVSDILKDLGVNLPEDAAPPQRLAVLQDWLAKNQGWLLVIDNVDDVDFIHDCGFNKTNGKVIYTSNDDRIFKIGTQIKLPKMPDETAMLLLYKLWQDEPDAQFEDIPEKEHRSLKGIAERFGNHPFSMVFVGSYLAEEDETLEEFLEAYQSKEKNLLAKYQFLSGYQYKNVATAFLLRFEQVSTPKDDTEREKYLSSAVLDYLKVSAFVGTDNIPEEFLQQSLVELNPDLAQWAEDKDFVKNIYKRFKPTSIFKRNAENKTLSTHRIVQEIMLFQIEKEEGTLLEAIARILAKNFEFFDFLNKEKVERYLLHVGVFLQCLEKNEPATKNSFKVENESTARLCNNYAQYFDEYGQYKKAEKYFELFRHICEATKDIDQTLLAESYNNLAAFYYLQGKYEKDARGTYEKAEFLQKKALQINLKALGENHSETAQNYNNLAAIYKAQGRYDEGESFYEKSLEIRKKVLGENDPLTASSYSNLAGLYFTKGNLELAKVYQQKSLAVWLANFGRTHPDVAGSYWWLGTFCKKEEKYQEALEYFSEAHEIYSRLLPSEHLHLQRLRTFIDDCELLAKK